MTSATRIILLGAAGQLGRSVQEAAALNPSIIIEPYSHEQLDLTDSVALQCAIKEWRDTVPRFTDTIIVNCAAYTAVDQAEEEAHRSECEWLNHHLPRILAQSALPLIHISTDYVFDGEQQTPYKEDSPTAPRSVYGSTKLLGEQAIAAAHTLGQYCIIRTQWLYAPWGKNFVRTMIRLAQEGKPLRVVADQIGSPTYAPTLAREICHIALRYSEDRHFLAPLLHYSNSGECSWYDLARAAIEAACPDYPSEQISPIATEQYPTLAYRPRYSTLCTERYSRLYHRTPPTWRADLAHCIDRLDSTDQIVIS